MQNYLTFPNTVRLLAPWLFGGLAAWVCNSNFGPAADTGRCAGLSESLNGVLPATAFVVIWNVVLILVGIAWFLCSANNGNLLVDFLFLLNVGFVVLWVTMYGCHNYSDESQRNKSSLYIQIPALMAAIALVVGLPAWTNLLVVPYVGWMIFASVLVVLLALNSESCNKSSEPGIKNDE